MSQINTNGINANYPVPGTNNSSQGFRDNFAQIRTNFNTAANEITDLQNKVVLKAALNDSVLNNNMGNTLISNASTSGFRATTYNLGSSLSGIILVDVNRADVQYGTVTGNVTFQFGGWAPTNTESNVVLRLNVANTDAVISWPSEVVSSNNNYGVTLIENYADIAGTATVTAPAQAEILEYTLSTLDCGNSITVAPNNRPFQSTQVITREPSPTGLPGDVNGKIAVGQTIPQITITDTYANDEILTSDTSSLYVDLPITFTGTTFGGITAGTTYYVAAIPSATNFTVATTAGGANVNLSAASGTMYGNPGSYLYICTGSFDSLEYPKSVTATSTTGNLITLNNVNNLVANAPIIFTGDVDTANTNIVENQVYYIKNISGSDITVSLSRFLGIAGAEYPIGDNDAGWAGASATCYIGSDIWKRVSLSAW